MTNISCSLFQDISTKQVDSFQPLLGQLCKNVSANSHLRLGNKQTNDVKQRKYDSKYWKVMCNWCFIKLVKCYLFTQCIIHFILGYIQCPTYLRTNALYSLLQAHRQRKITVLFNHSSNVSFYEWLFSTLEFNVLAIHVSTFFWLFNCLYITLLIYQCYIELSNIFFINILISISCGETSTEYFSQYKL